ncbi:FAD-dependent oxidoreductase [Halovenus rubra]|uniref:FAD-dependent oxidoreductase n=2 Tax=Halovenus rubra TaxID=869890 RepID=A0ACC7E299_9EURY|nr:FAD-dependent oxidoreductase [Halovenus rubra]
MPEIAVVGGGIGGLSAAHELVDRGFDVTVFEANDRFGGKARSMDATDGPNPLHGEHGFRFFPAFYRHVFETMERIPDGNGTVADNLVETEQTLIAAVDGPERVASSATPDSIQGWLDAARPAFAEDLPRTDVAFLLERLLYLLTACESRREEELDEVSWWEFIDAENRSPEFRDRLGYAVQSLVALRPQVGSARTVGSIYTQLLFGQMNPQRPTEQILNAPTSEAWIEPWVDYLDAHGVTLHSGRPAQAFEASGERIDTLVLADGERISADAFVLAVPVEVAPSFVSSEMAAAAPELSDIDRLDTAWMNGVQFYLTEDVQLSRGHQVYADAPWALTSISQRQFWPEYDIEGRGPDAVEGVLSVIASDWDTPGILHGKPARECTREEIQSEIWAQLKTHLNTEESRLSDEMLVDTFLDPAIVESTSGVTNQSPLLINTVGSLKNRPPANVGIDNLVVASDYVRTNSDLASMESANEAGRRAANALFEQYGIGDRAQVWELQEPSIFEPFKRQDRLRYRLGLPHPAEVTQSLRSVSSRLLGSA